MDNEKVFEMSVGRYIHLQLARYASRKAVRKQIHVDLERKRINETKEQRSI